MSKPTKRARNAQREKQRAIGKLGKKLDRLVLESAGGSPERAIEVSSAAVIDARARTFRCGRCEGELQWRADHAEFLGRTQLRRVDLICKQCFHPRVVWFSLGVPTAN